MPNYFLDTEFNDSPQGLQLISIGITDEHGNDYYAVTNEFTSETCNEWVKQNILPKLGDKKNWKSKLLIRDELIEYFNRTNYEGSRITIYGWYCSHDWLLFCNLFGGLINLPYKVNQASMDIRQICSFLALPINTAQPKDAHNALVDARWTRDLYRQMMVLCIDK